MFFLISFCLSLFFSNLLEKYLLGEYYQRISFFHIPVLIILTSTMIWIGFLHPGLLKNNLFPENISKSLQIIEDFVFYINCQGEIIYCNKPQDYFKIFGDVKDDNELFEKIKKLEEKETLFFRLNKEEVIKKNMLVGYIVVLSNVTKELEIEKELQSQNEILKQSNKQLEHEIDLESELQVKREQLKLMKKVQTFILKDLIKSLNLISKLKIVDNEKQARLEYCQELSNLLRETYKKTREVVQDMKSQNKDEGVQNDTSTNR